MKKIFSTLTTFMIAFLVYGQQKLSYTYDAAGNRTNRTIAAAVKITSEGLEEESAPPFLNTLQGKNLSVRRDSCEYKNFFATHDYLFFCWTDYSISDIRQFFSQKYDLPRNFLEQARFAPKRQLYLLHFFNRQAFAWKFVKL